MNKNIELPHGGEKASFILNELINYFKVNKLSFMIIGNAHVSYKNHRKKHSFDIWLRNHSSVKKYAKNTCQAVKSVINEVVSTGLFSVDKCKCPTTMKLCNALVYKTKSL